MMRATGTAMLTSAMRAMLRFSSDSSSGGTESRWDSIHATRSGRPSAIHAAQFAADPIRTVGQCSTRTDDGCGGGVGTGVGAGGGIVVMSVVLCGVIEVVSDPVHP